MIFYKLLQEAYDYWKGKVSPTGEKYVDEENIYITDGKYHQAGIKGSRRMYIGDDLVGDSYDTQIDISREIPSDVGAIRKGTSMKDLLTSTKGSQSRVLDSILFPTYAPVYIEPTYKHNINTDNVYLWCGSYIPSISIYDATSAYCYVSKYTIPAGITNVTFDIKYTDHNGESYTETQTISVPSGSTSFSEQLKESGHYTITTSVGCELGTSTIFDSSLTPCSVYALSEKTLLSDAKEAAWIEHSGSSAVNSYVLSARSGVDPVTINIYTCLPIYTDKYVYGSTQYTPEDTYKSYTDEGMIITLGPQKSAYLLIPEGYEIDSLYQNSGDGFCTSINLANCMVIDATMRAKKTPDESSIEGLYSSWTTNHIIGIVDTTVGPNNDPLYLYKYVFDKKTHQFCGDESTYLLKLKIKS